VLHVSLPSLTHESKVHHPWVVSLTDAVLESLSLMQSFYQFLAADDFKWEVPVGVCVRRSRVHREKTGDGYIEPDLGFTT